MPNNRMWNIKNPYQGNALKVLCVCSAGLLRSPTTANVLHKKYGYNTRAAGVDTDHALIPVDEVLLEWADQIVCMENTHRQYILNNFNADDAKIVVLGISDSYGWNEDPLPDLILKSYAEVGFYD